MKITHAEVRQEIEKMFGPDIMGNLDKAGLSFDEAWKMTETDLTIRRTLSARVHSKAVKHVTPQRLRSFYVDYAKENQKEACWDYRVITVRGKDSASCLKTAQNIVTVLEDKEISLERLQKELKKRELLIKGTTISVTEEMKHTKQEIAEDLQEKIASLSANTYSEPLELISKKTGKMVYRILYVNNHTQGGVPAFKDIEARLQNFLVGQEIQKETVTYLAKLRKRYSDKENTLEELLPKEFTPFTLIQ
jgi:hypothetical protein